MSTSLVYWLSVVFMNYITISLHEEIRNVSVQNDITANHNKCEPITVPFCIDIAYNSTIMPNSFNHQNQEDISLDIHQYTSLVAINCSPDLKLFLCSVFVPACTVLDRSIPPCRSLCLSAKNGCEPVLKKFGFDWPVTLDCAQYPEKQYRVTCVGESNIIEEGPSIGSSNSSLQAAPAQQEQLTTPAPQVTPIDRPKQEILKNDASSILNEIGNALTKIINDREDPWNVFGKFVANEIRIIKNQSLQLKCKREIVNILFKYQEEADL